MATEARKLPDITAAEEGALCPYCGTDKYVVVIVDADDFTVCALDLFYALDLPFGWNLSRGMENAIAAREAARNLPARRRL